MNAVQPGRILAAALALCLCLPAGCRKTVIPEPDARELRDALEGQVLEAEGQTFRMETASIRTFKVLEFYHNRERQTSVAQVEFVYSAGERRFLVQGVISYLRADSAPLVTEPRFEPNEVTAL